MGTVLVTGSHGLIGTAVARSLLSAGTRVVRLVRPGRPPGPDDVAWDPERGRIDSAGLGGLDAVVHLAGESIAAARWTAERKARIWRSRVDGTGLLSRALATLADPPRTFACASAVGYYGDRGDEWLREGSGPGAGFLPDLCRAWEAAAAPALAAGIRVVHLRLGTVLSRCGGMLPRVLPLFRVGLGGAIGNGRQFMSWIALADASDAILHVLRDDGLAGPVNVAAPHPVTNREFTHVLGRVLRRPTVVAVPAAALRMMFGGLADEALLASTRVGPARLLERGFRFQFPLLKDALGALVGHRDA